jgi:SAM-dependent methyltransferase
MPYFDTFFDLPPTGFGRRLQFAKARQVLQRLQYVAPTLKNLLEIGPGWGELAEVCCSAGVQHSSVEINHRRARSLIDRGLPAIIASVPPIPVRDQSFDAVVALNVLEHMPDLPAAIGFVREMIRAARPGGLICLNCPDLIASGSLFWDADYTHNFPTSLRRLSQMYRDLGLSIVDATYFAGPVAGTWATPIGWIARFFPVSAASFLIGRLADAGRIRRAQLTFMRNVFIVGRVPDHAEPGR